MSIDDEIYPANFARDAGGDIFTRYAARNRIVARRLVQPGVDRHQHDVGARGTDLSDCRSYGWNYVTEVEPPTNVLGVPQRDPRRRRADDSNFYSLALDDGPRAIGVDVARLDTIGIGGEERKGCLSYDAVEIRHAVVELVVPEGGRVVTHRVHRCDDRICAVGGHPRRHVRQRVALMKVSGVE